MCALVDIILGVISISTMSQSFLAMYKQKKPLGDMQLEVDSLLRGSICIDEQVKGCTDPTSRSRSAQQTLRGISCSELIMRKIWAK